MKCIKTAIILIFWGTVLHAQQNLTLYYLPENPQINTLNPAYQISCKWFLGIPVLTSLHLNEGFNGFSYNQLFKNGTPNYIKSSNFFWGNKISLNGEAYIEWLNLGIWYKKNYFTFTISEKLDNALIFHKNFFKLLMDGNTQFEGENANLNGMGPFLDYRREFAFGISHKINHDLTLGFKAKILFGKLNLHTQKSKSNFYTDATSFNLRSNTNFKVNASGPMDITANSSGEITDISLTGDVMSFFMNPKNPGFAIDLGIIKKINEQETFSASILDLGFIHYSSSDSYSYTGTGVFEYSGQLSNNTNPNNYFNELLQNFTGQISGTLEKQSYWYFLPTRIYVGYQNQLSPKFIFNSTATTKIYRFKLIPGLSAGATYTVFKHISVAASWIYNYRSFKNIGAGLLIGRSPIQFYAFTDNILGFTNPLSVRDFNLRFGINLIFGCYKKKKITNCGCKYIEDAEKDRERYRTLRKL